MLAHMNVWECESVVKLIKKKTEKITQHFLFIFFSVYVFLLRLCFNLEHITHLKQDSVGTPWLLSGLLRPGLWSFSMAFCPVNLVTPSHTMMCQIKCSVAARHPRLFCPRHHQCHPYLCWAMIFWTSCYVCPPFHGEDLHCRLSSGPDAL